MKFLELSLLSTSDMTLKGRRMWRHSKPFVKKGRSKVTRSYLWGEQKLYRLLVVSSFNHVNHMDRKRLLQVLLTFGWSFVAIRENESQVG